MALLCSVLPTVQEEKKILPAKSLWIFFLQNVIFRRSCTSVLAGTNMLHGHSASHFTLTLGELSSKLCWKVQKVFCLSASTDVHPDSHLDRVHVSQCVCLTRDALHAEGVRHHFPPWAECSEEEEKLQGLNTIWFWLCILLVAVVTVVGVVVVVPVVTFTMLLVLLCYLNGALCYLKCPLYVFSVQFYLYCASSQQRSFHYT